MRGIVGLVRGISIYNYFWKIFVDQVNEDIVAVTRHNPSTHESVLLIANTCFSISTFKWTPNCRPIQIADEIIAILFELKTVEVTPTEKQIDETTNADEIITGLPNFQVECYENVKLDASDAIEIRNGTIHFKLFLSGSVIALKFSSLWLNLVLKKNI